MATEMGLAARLKQAQENGEDAIVRTVAEETAKLPSDTFLWAALSALGMSLALFKTGRKADAMFGSADHHGIYREPTFQSILLRLLLRPVRRAAASVAPPAAAG